jgi:hypothetical protein
MTRGGSARQFEIVGLVSDTHDYNVRTQPAPAVWFAIQQDTPYMPTLHVRTAAADTGSVLAAVRGAFDALDKGFPIFDIETLERRIEDSLSRERLVADISAVFGMVALLLAGIGLYGVLAYSVTRRTREIGVRMALGSSASSVVSMIAREGLVLMAAGAIVGLGIGGEVLHHAHEQPRAARRPLRRPGSRVSRDGAGKIGALPEAVEGVEGVALAVGVPAEQIEMADRSPVVRAAVVHDDEVTAEIPGADVDAGEAAARTQRARRQVAHHVPLADEHAEARVVRRARALRRAPCPAPPSKLPSLPRAF